MICQHREWVQISEPEFVILPEPGIEIEEVCLNCRESRKRILSQEEPEQCPHEWYDITCVQHEGKIFSCSKCGIRADTLGKHYPHGVRMLEGHLKRGKNLIEIVRLQAQTPMTSDMGHPNLEQLAWDMVTDLDNVMLEMRVILERFKRTRIPHELLSQNPIESRNKSRKAGRKRRVFSSTFKAEVAAAIESGLKTAEAARKFKISEMSVRRICYKAGVKLPPPGRPKAKLDANLPDLPAAYKIDTQAYEKKEGSPPAAYLGKKNWVFSIGERQFIPSNKLSYGDAVKLAKRMAKKWLFTGTIELVA